MPCFFFQILPLFKEALLCLWKFTLKDASFPIMDSAGANRVSVSRTGYAATALENECCEIFIGLVRKGLWNVALSECQTFVKDPPLAKGWLYLLRWVLYVLINRLHLYGYSCVLHVNAAFFLKKTKKTALIPRTWLESELNSVFSSKAELRTSL